MPRRPNTKNLPSRLFEETSTPVYVVDSTLRLVYVNPALAKLWESEREQIVGVRLKYLADVDPANGEAGLFTLCPPPRLWPEQGARDASVARFPATFRVLLKDGQNYQSSCLAISDDHELASQLLVCSLYPIDEDSSSRSESVPTDWLHQRIMDFRRQQSSRFNSIPYLGDSPQARKCFAQARAYALLESNVSLVGHPQGQVVDVAKAIHYSGFTSVEDPDPLLPVNCEMVKGERIQEILIGHCQANQQPQGTSTAYVLLMNAESLDPMAQRDLLTFDKTARLQVRFLTTSKTPLSEINGFDLDLAHRLSTLELILPDLNHRREDVIFLAQNILEKNNDRPPTISEELLQCLQVYPWRLDYQELESVVLAASKNCASRELTVADCPHDFRMALKAQENPIPKLEPIELDDFLAKIEQEAITRAIRAAQGNKTNAAKILGITRARLHRKIAEMNGGVADAEFRNEE